MNADGSEEKQIKSLRGGAPTFLSDGRILFHSEYSHKESEISIADVDGQHIIHLTDNEAEEWDAKVSPDGKQIAFTSNRDGNHEIYVMNLDGSNQQRLTHNDTDDFGPTWSADGSRLIFQSKRGDKTNLYMMNKDGSSIKQLISDGWQPACFQSNQVR